MINDAKRGVVALATNAARALRLLPNGGQAKFDFISLEEVASAIRHNLPLPDGFSFAHGPDYIDFVRTVDDDNGSGEARLRLRETGSANLLLTFRTAAPFTSVWVISTTFSLVFYQDRVVNVTCISDPHYIIRGEVAEGCRYWRLLVAYIELLNLLPGLAIAELENEAGADPNAAQVIALWHTVQAVLDRDK